MSCGGGCGDPCSCADVSESTERLFGAIAKVPGQLAGAGARVVGDLFGTPPLDDDNIGDKPNAQLVENVVKKNYGATGTDMQLVYGTQGDVFQAIAIHPTSEVHTIVLIPNSQSALTEPLDMSRVLKASVGAPLIQPVQGPLVIMSEEAGKDALSTNIGGLRLGLSLYRYRPNWLPTRRPPARWVASQNAGGTVEETITWVETAELGPRSAVGDIPAHGRRRMDLAIKGAAVSDITTTVYGITYWGTIEYTETLVQRNDVATWEAHYESEAHFDAYRVTMNADAAGASNKITAVLTLRDED